MIPNRWRSRLPGLWLCSVLLAGAVGLGTGGCALAGRGGADEEEEEPGPREITLHVRNDNFYDATLYAMSESGHRVRLGVTSGLGRGTFRFRWNYQELRVVIDFLAAGTSLTESLPVSQGDELELTISPDAHRRE